jgi:hypothetical protein
MRRYSIAFLVTFGLLALAVPADADDPIQVARDIPYAEGSSVPTNVREKCTQLGTKLAASLEEFGAEYGVSVVLADELDTTAPGKVFRVEITNAVSGGNAFIGHRKSMSAKGELFVDGVSKGKADFRRDSGGGFGAGFKGSCSVLGRCSRTLGNDFAKWLKDQQ